MNPTASFCLRVIVSGALLICGSTNISAFQDDPFGSSSDSMAKKTTETWQQYMTRMNAVGVVDGPTFKRWQSGQSVNVPRTVAVMRMRTETRSRRVPVTMMRTETNDDGQEIQVPYTENRTQSYTVQVPYTEQVVQNVKIPAPGTQAENSPFSGFSGPKNAHLPFPPQRQQAPSFEDFHKSTVKAGAETWQAYLNRLKTLKVVNRQQISQWKKGQPLEIKTNVPFTRTRQETRTRSVPVTRMVTQTNDDGETIQVPTQQIVQQNYTVQVPYTEMVAVSVSIPAMGAAADSATNSGAKISGWSGKKNNSRSARAAKKSRSNKKPSARLISLMKIRPKQSQARYDRKYDLSELDIRDFEKDGSRIQEVKRGSRTLRQFADTDGDNKIDTWIFFKDDEESYREQDLDGDGKVDQYQFREDGKVRNGIDEDQDGEIDIWD